MSMASKYTPSRADYYHWNRVTTRWADNDCYGHVNNAVYYTYIDSVVNQYLIENAGLLPQTSPIIGLVVQSTCQYKGSFAYPQNIDAGLRVLKLGNSSVEYEVGMFSEDDEVARVWGGFVHVFVERQSQKPIAIPIEMRSSLSSLAA
ncbi:MAG: acyl-CoA thioester hydrolase [Parasphingorhabdus sp.]|jgi:acyl-CoA thioester hydrolase